MNLRNTLAVALLLMHLQGSFSGTSQNRSNSLPDSIDIFINDEANHIWDTFGYTVWQYFDPDKIPILLFQGPDTFGPDQSYMPENELVNIIRSTDGLVAFWKFDEQPGKMRTAIGSGRFPLLEGNGAIERICEGPVSGYSIKLDGSDYLTLSNSEAGKLNIYGDGAEVTVVAWVKWTGEQTGFVGGMWNEYQEGGKRQYGLFISLPHYNGQDQVCGHISMTGKPTPPFPFSIDYSASKQYVPKDEWCCVAFTYDGQYIKSFLNGEFRPREPELIENTEGFEGYPQGLIQSKNPYYFPFGMKNNGSDFTVGAVRLKSGMGNYYKGLIGGIAVFKRALNDIDLKRLAKFNQN